MKPTTSSSLILLRSPLHSCLHMSTTHGGSLLEFLLEMRHTSDFSNLACDCAVLLSKASPSASLDEYRAFLIAFSTLEFTEN